MNNTGYFGPRPANRPRILAHRGLTFLSGKQVADENTFLAFQNAVEVGADYLESDIQVSSDGVPVLFHDLTLSRLTGNKKRISDLSIAEISAITLPLGGKIPTLRSALERFPDQKFNLDIKIPQAAAPAIAVIESLKAEPRVLISSFRDQLRRQALALTSSVIATSPGVSKVAQSYFAALLGTRTFFNSTLKSLDALQLPTKLYGLDFTAARFVQQVLDHGIELHYWTINDPEEMQMLFALGAHGIVTDRADLALKAFS